MKEKNLEQKETKGTKENKNSPRNRTAGWKLGILAAPPRRFRARSYGPPYGDPGNERQRETTSK
jgi:hypothetical protein